MKNDIYDSYEVTVGIECHVQLATKTKLFSGSDNDARDRPPNEVINEIDYGLPGMLPVLNKHAVQLAIRAGLALNSEIANISRFDRKHYFYPDLPKGYQITQLFKPIILNGSVNVPLADGSNIPVRIHHAHLEEDAGKLTHYSDYSLVDLNRAGTPLIEIVSEPDIHSAEVARAFAYELYLLMTYAGVTIGDLYHGNMRFDVNISVAKKESNELGKRTEIKNLNSFKSVEKVVEYEFKRQIDLIESGQEIVQETRGWDEIHLKTTSQRSKEDAQDYRYMPEPDVPPIVLSIQDIDEERANLPTLPSEYRTKWSQLGLDISVLNALLANKNIAKTIGAVQDVSSNDTATRVAHWFTSASEVEGDSSQNQASVEPERLIELSDMVKNQELNSTAAKAIFNELLNGNDDSPRSIAESKNLIQVSDESAIIEIVDQVMQDPMSQKAIEDIRSGNEKAIGYLVGQIMKLSQGKANPALAQKLLRKKL